MDQIICPVQGHQSNIERFCYFENCQETKRVMCDECYQLSKHRDHKCQKKINEIFQFLDDKQGECKFQIIDIVDQMLGQLQANFNELKKGLQNKYLLSKQQIQVFDGNDIHEYLCSLVKLPELYPDLNNINEIVQNLIQNIEQFKTTFNISCSTFIQSRQENQDKSDIFFERGYNLVVLVLDKFELAIEALDQSLKYNERNVDSLWCKSTCLQLKRQSQKYKLIGKVI